MGAVGGVRRRHQADRDCGGCPPDEPPGRVTGIPRVARRGELRGSVVADVASSAVLVRPSGMKPAARNCSAR
jgi:hypothetical protein